ncbi:hypothetical protein SYNTR_0296 [Candidatus Syntrophocurvum alkaliphilum]|uniref:Coenzyme F420:L-glutamate ligase-like domain-containing protein n=1 Tax=Candidatus Syntrophocurvum alkaliphilum TaxID=2293317 RepID=A0A6I6DGY5_9FIRM|nr:coenzyme F420-0:L-glutamate ligase [Candidatus Syntrophocurvum alkaliphilum]QGT98889.1 hypothetical protein SYNTR_0296 [Candidatus Syntrophocurvum alkaliphilum]
MGKLPDYIGISAFGIKMGVIIPGSDVVNMVYEALQKLESDGLLDDGDTICVTESIVARAQNNYVTVKDIADQVTNKLNLKKDSKIGVVFPILSRNRFSLILKGLAKAVPQGEVVVQLSHPSDEVGNQILPYDFAENIGKTNGEIITCQDLGNNRYKHPITKVDYISLYEEIIKEQGAQANIFLCNSPSKITEFKLDGIVVSSVHNRQRVLTKIKETNQNSITLQELCNEGDCSSEWGLLGSNISAGDKLKLAPKAADEVARLIQEKVIKDINKKVEVIIYGDGAYCDPTTGIYELADPKPTFGMTDGLKGKYREGVKYKYLVDQLYSEGADLDNIEKTLQAKSKDFDKYSIEAEGTTPRKTEDLIASLADLVSGSADAGTPVIVVKGFLNGRIN